MPKPQLKWGDWNAICSACKEEKSLSEFSIRSDTGKPRAQCKVCRQKVSGAYIKANPDKRHTPDREKANAAVRKWRKQNLAYDAARAQVYRTRKLNQMPSWADAEKIFQFYDNCPKGYHVDHIVPLKGKYVRGFHVIDNLQYLPALENIKKGNRYGETVSEVG